MPYKDYHWEEIAHDYNSPYLRNHLWTEAILKYPRLLGISSPALGILSSDNQIYYIGDLASWGKTHEELKAKILANCQVFDDLIEKTLAWGEEFNAWTEKNIFNVALNGLDNNRLAKLLKEFIDRQSDGYAYGTAMPTLDFLSFSFVEGNLNRFLKEKVPPEKFGEYYEIFTDPAHNSFAQDQEEDLLRLMSEYYDRKGWREMASQESWEKTKEAFPDFAASLESHSRKYAWVYYVYMGPAYQERDFYGFIKDHLAKGVNPSSKLAELEEKKKEIAKRREDCLTELRPEGLDEFVLKTAGKMVWAKPRRKDLQSKSYYHVEKLLREIARRLFISLDQVRSLPTGLISKALAGEEVELSIANEIKRFHVCLPDDGRVVDLFGQPAREFYEKELKKMVTAEQGSRKELQGTSACPGQAKGKVKVINIPAEMAKMESGDILVSTATTPSIVPAMKKAAAILTDEGGLTCHASIVSRELDIPCVVGLKVATSILKDGDLVEVDAKKGIVKIIKK